MPLFLTGCIGSFLSGRTEYLHEGYPNILTVPEREEASRPRGFHVGDERKSRAAEFKKLEQAREEIKARDEALREGKFPDSQEKTEETAVIPDDTDDSLGSVELDRVVP